MLVNRTLEQIISHPSGPFNLWLGEIIKALGITPTDVSKRTGIARDQIIKLLNNNITSINTATKVCACLGVPYSSKAEIEAAGFDPGPTWTTRERRGVGHRKARTLTEALEIMERVPPEPESRREEAMRAALDTISEDRPSFLAVATIAIMPSPFDQTRRYAPLREAVYAAHERGLMALFIVPDEGKVKSIAEMCGFNNLISTEAFEKGFTLYRQGYVDRRRAAGSDDPEADADSKMHLLRYDAFEITQWRYIVCLFGEVESLGYAPKRVVERGPATRGRIMVVPRDPTQESGMQAYMERALRRIYGCDLRLMSWGDGPAVPTSGRNLVIVGTDSNGLLHIRIFDASGSEVTNTDETKLPATQAGAISALKQQLPGLSPPHVLTSADKAQLVSEATSIVGRTRIYGDELPPFAEEFISRMRGQR